MKLMDPANRREARIIAVFIRNLMKNMPHYNAEMLASSLTEMVEAEEGNGEMQLLLRGCIIALECGATPGDIATYLEKVGAAD